ncbi:MAG: phosphate ABC transporter substrate-binding protein PstS [Thaumarchaeota archaeon]|nr:phosphate ABC transporter substrate-binding protein PstS [Nitrososphaerota archaeon]MCL5318338.1 phosphate ABC transporter substrate-binding protein PstS [Nitrososphaerota archaeon]
MRSKRVRKAVAKTTLVVGTAAIIVAAGIIAYLALPQAAKPQQGITSQTPSVTINGAGATFPYPLLSTMTVEYNKIHPNVKIGYQSIGSGGGIRQLTEKTVDFAASDAPLNAKQRDAAPNTLHIPETIGSVVLAYNLPGVEKGLKITGPIIADIFLGKITKWNDPAIQNLNPDLKLPNNDIQVAHRSDGSGTTFIWTSYLSLVSPDWNSKVGSGTAVQWPVGLGSSGNEGVAGLVRGTQYTVGYVELAYALQNKMSYAFIQNKEGKFIEPTLGSTGASVSSIAASLPRGDQSWENVSILNAAGADSYPIASFSYLLIYKDLSTVPSMNKEKAKALVDFLWWVVHDGQNYSSNLQYVPLPKSVISIDEQTINSITFNGQPLRSQ